MKTTTITETNRSGLSSLLCKSKGLVTISFIKKNGTKRVVTGTMTMETPDSLGYLLVKEALTNEYKRIDPRSLEGAIIEQKEYVCQR